MLLHAAIHWPEAADAQLWPMAVQHAVWLHNHVPRADACFHQKLLEAITIFGSSRVWMPHLRIGQENARRKETSSLAPLK
jgi:oligoribonuclease (3'-5' exoribonuclease)